MGGRDPVFVRPLVIVSIMVMERTKKRFLELWAALMCHIPTLIGRLC